jgi:hypothetical protein
VTRSSGRAFEYDVVLSFAGEDRAYVEEVATHLKASGVKVFYDAYEQAALWGKDLYSHLDETYRRKGRYCVMFISRAYRGKVWTNHERQSAQARAFEESKEYILPARFDDTEIPGIRPTVGYVDLRSMTPKQLADLILEKLGHAEPRPSTTAPTALPSRPYRKPRTGFRSFNPYEEALAFISQLIAELKRRCEEIGEEGVSASAFERKGLRCLRVVVDGRTVYSLDVGMGGIGGDSSVQFHGVPGELRSSPGTMNAWADIVWDKSAERVVLSFHDFSLLGHFSDSKQLTPEEFTEAVWDRICNAIEESDQ